MPHQFLFSLFSFLKIVQLRKSVVEDTLQNLFSKMTFTAPWRIFFLWKYIVLCMNELVKSRAVFGKDQRMHNMLTSSKKGKIQWSMLRHDMTLHNYWVLYYTFYIFIINSEVALLIIIIGFWYYNPTQLSR